MVSSQTRSCHVSRTVKVVALLAQVIVTCNGQMRELGPMSHYENGEDSGLPGPYPMQSTPSPGYSTSTETSERDKSPGALQWILAVVLGVSLIGGLVRVYRVLQIADSFSPRRQVPDGMRPVECGACRTMQYVTNHGRIFLCYRCQSVNRLPADAQRSDSQELVAPTGPLKRYEFVKGGDNYWQETKQEDIEEGPDTAAAIALRDQPITIGKRYRDEPATNLQAETESNISRHSTRSRTSCAELARCVVCLDALGNMVLLPCAHGSVCEECTTRIVQNGASGGSHCPHCRSSIKTLVKLQEIDGINAKGIEFRIPMARPH